MAHQLIFTSLARTLKGGSGYGTAAQTPNFPNVLSEELSKLAGYVEIYPGGDPNRRYNPINYFFLKFNNWYILGRLSSADNDYSGRFNYLGQFFALDHSELQECGPVALLESLPFLPAFQGEARLLPPCVIPKVSPPPLGICNNWAAATGDGGWGGVLAERLQSQQHSSVLYDKSLHGNKCLSLVGETLNLLSPVERWNFTFSTHVEGFPKGNQVRLRMLQQGGELTRDFKSNPQCFDLTKGDLPPAVGGDLVTVARTGIRSTPLASFTNPLPQLTASSSAHSISGSPVHLEPKGNSPYGLVDEMGMPPPPGPRSNPTLPPSQIPAREPGKKPRNFSKRTSDRTELDYQETSSGGTPWWFYVASAVGILIAFGIGMWSGTQFSRQSLDESQHEIAAKEKEVENKITELSKSEKQHKDFQKDITNQMQIEKQKTENAIAAKTIWEEKSKELEKFKFFLINKSGLTLKKSDTNDALLNDAEAQLKEKIEFYKKYKAAETIIIAAISNPDHIKSIIKTSNEIASIEFTKNPDIDLITKYDSTLKLSAGSKFGGIEESKKSELKLLKTLEEIKTRQAEKARRINDDKTIASNPESLAFIFGESSGQTNDYKFATNDYFKGNENEKELRNPDSARSKDFIKRCAIFFLDKTKSNELFSENGKLDRFRYEFLKANGKNIVTHINAHKENGLLKGREMDIEKFNNAMTEVFRIK